MKVISDNDYFVYENQKINVLLQRYIYDKGEYGDKFEFDYKNNTVFMFYEEDKSWYQLAQTICKLIDMQGYEGYKTFYEYYQEKKRIEKKYIVVDGKVYKPYINDDVRSGSLIYYFINMKMYDGESLDGRISGDVGNPFYNDVYDKGKLMNTLRRRVQAYYQKNKILPSDEHYMKDTTEKYEEITKWYTEHNIELE